MNKTTQFTAEQQFLRSIRDQIAALRKQEKEVRLKAKAARDAKKEARKAIREQVREIQNLVVFVKEYGHENGLAANALAALKKVVNVDHFNAFLKAEAEGRKAKAEGKVQAKEPVKAQAKEPVKVG